MAHKDGEASVEDILRSIKQVISREDGPRRSADTFARDAARENGQPVPERPASFSPYGFQRSSPFGARSADAAPPAEPAEVDDIADEGRTDVFDLRSLDSNAFDVEEAGEDEAAMHDGDRPIILPPPEGDDNIVWAGRERADDRKDEIQSRSDGEAADHSAPAHERSGSEEPLELVEPEEETVKRPEPTAQETAAAPVTDPYPGTTEGLIAGAAADALRNRFSALQQAANRPAAAPSPGNPLEEVVRDMLRPMLKQWLDENMPGLVEKIVEREIARITGRL